MYQYCLIFKGTNKNLAICEFKILYKTYFGNNIEIKELENNIYYCKTKSNINKNVFLKRLTYTNKIIKIINRFDNLDDYENNIINYRKDIRKFENLKFFVRKIKPRKDFNIGIDDKRLAKPIWLNLENPKVSINDFDVEFDFVFCKDIKGFYFGNCIFDNDKNYLERMPKKRPIKMPYTLKSDMARCAINLLGIKKGIILDPFTGIGGILLEACDMNFDIIANDISKKDLKYLKKNFDFYYPGIKYKVMQNDAKYQFLDDNSIDGIVTDIPYGRCSRRLGEDLYENFLKNAKQMLKPNKRLVVIYSNFVDFEKYALKYFKYIDKQSEYMNASMTRYILILENSNK